MTVPDFDPFTIARVSYNMEVPSSSAMLFGAVVDPRFKVTSFYIARGNTKAPYSYSNNEQ